MGAEHAGNLRESLASALEWWRDAGIDTLTEDDATDWLARPVVAPAAAAAVAAPPVETLAANLDDFVAWRMADSAPEAGWMSPRIGPGGDPASRFVVLVDAPCAEDSETLLGGAEGRLFDRMLAAIGLNRESVYLTALAWARPVTGQIPPGDAPRLIELARHHLTLLRPERLLLVGQAAAAVIEDDGLDHVNHFGGDTQVAAIRHPRFLMDRPAAKSEAWKQLLRLTRGSQ